MKRTLIVVALLVVVLGAALPYAPVDFMKAPMERALEHGLGRRVEVDRVSLTLFSGPGFSLDGVTIHEDPRAGIEPFAYANTLDARLDAWALLRGRLEFSSLHLNDATFNLVKPDDAPWNFQMLFNTTSTARLPALKMRGGRVNFKFGQSKSVLFFDDTDLDVSPRGNGAMDLRFSGAPARTDRSAQNFGHFFVRGTSARSAAGPQLNLQVELEPSALDAVARLFTNDGIALKGIVALEAQVQGAPSHLDVNGWIQLVGGGQWRLGYKGALDLVAQTLDLQTQDPKAASPLSVRVSTRELLSRPHWDIEVDLKDAPLAAAVDIARKLGAPIPEKVSAAGGMIGLVRYSNTDGLGGNVEVHDVTVTLPDAAAIKAATATVFLKRETVLVGPVTVNLGEKETAEVETTYQAGEGGGTEVKITTRRMSMTAAHAIGLTDVPVLDRVTGGSWRGVVRYARPAAGSAAWSGEFEMQNMQVAVDGLAETVHLQSAAVSVKPEVVAVSRISGKAGAVGFSGDYRWDADPAHAHKFRIQVEDADVIEIERLFHPSVTRPGGLLARTLGIGSAGTAPEWLKQRRAEGTLIVKGLTVADTRLTGTGRLAWEGTAVKISGITAKLGSASLNGELRMDLSEQTPRYGFEGKLEEFPYKGGKLDLNGKLDAAGSGLALLSSVRANGTLRGRSITLSPEAEYRRVSGRFEMSVTAAGPKWKLSELDLWQGADSYSGEGALQADGKLVLDVGRHN